MQEAKTSLVWDEEIRGLGLRVKPSGTKTFFIQYRNEARRTRRLVLGQYGVMTVEMARAAAREHLAEVLKGKDPSAERKALYNACTIKDLCYWYLKEADSGRLLGKRRRPIKTSTLKMDRSRIECHIIPLLGTQMVSGLKRADIEKLQADVAEGKTSKSRTGPRGGNTTGGPGAACRTVSTLHAVCEHGIRYGIIETNPAKGVRKIAEQRRDRRLSEKEIIVLSRTLSQMAMEGDSPVAVACIKFILLTGFRRMEALALQADWIDRFSQCVRFPDTKSGRQTRVIGKAALAALKFSSSGARHNFVFPSEIGQGHFIGAPRVLERATARAGLAKVSLHTLRHTFASIGGELGFTELTLAGLLGHAARGVTQRYVHIDEALVVAADRISERIQSLLESGHSEAVIAHSSNTNSRMTKSSEYQPNKTATPAQARFN
jgi:integrase